MYSIQKNIPLDIFCCDFILNILHMSTATRIQEGRHYTQKEKKQETVFCIEHKLCLILAANGYTNKETAEELSYSESNVDRLFQFIYENLNEHTKISAGFTALTLGIITLDIYNHFKTHRNINLLKKTFFEN